MKDYLQSTGVIKPLNLDQPKYEAVFSMPLPDSIAVSIYMVRMPDMCPQCVDEKYGKIHDKLLRMISDLPAAAGTFGVTATISVDHGLDQGSSCTWLLDIPWGRSWAVDGLYAQVGIHNPKQVKSADPTVPVLAAMHNIDMHVAATGSTDPTLHKVVPADLETAQDFDMIVNGFFNFGPGIWCKSIVDFRFMMMIKTRALLLGHDPDQEYDQYIKSGGSTLVDYLNLGS